MFFTITRLGFAFSAPSLLLAQSLTTYSFTAEGTPTSLVFTIPTVHTTTITYTQAAYTTTLMPEPIIETHTFIITAPASEISSIQGALPQSIQVVAPSIAPGPMVPVVVGGYTATVEIPASASVSEGTYTPSPVHIAAETPASTLATAADTSPAALNSISAASQEAAVSSNVAGDSNTLATSASSTPSAAVTVASNPAAVISSTVSGIPTNLPIPIGPLTQASAAVQSSMSTASGAASSAGAGVSSAASGTILASTEGFVSTASVPTAIITDTSSLPAPTATTVTSTSTSTSQGPSTLATSSSAAASSASSSSSTTPFPTPSSSSSSTTATPRASSTAAPQSGATGRKVVGSFLGAAAGVCGLLVFV